MCQKELILYNPDREVETVRMPGAGEWAVILLIALIIFGPSKLPELGKALGKGIREFKGASMELKKSLEEDDAEAESKS